MRRTLHLTLAGIAVGLLGLSQMTGLRAEEAAAEAPQATPSIIISVGWEKRPLGRYANRFARGAERLCGTAQSQSPGVDGGYAAAYATYAAAYGRSAGTVVTWSYSGPFGGIDREEAYAHYNELRYQQALHDYYAHLYAWNAYVESGSTMWSAASAKAYQAVYYAWADIEG